MNKFCFAIGLLMLLAATHLTAAEPKPVRLAKAAPIPPQVMMQVVVFQVDCDKLRDSDFNLARFFTLKPSSPDSEPPAVVSDSLNDREMSLLLYLLKSKGVGEILSRPQIMTLEGQEATVQIGTEVPLLVVEETINGKTTSRVETRASGITLDVTPARCTPRTVQLELSIGETKYFASGEGANEQPHPLLKQQKIDVTVEANFDKTLLLTEGTLVQDRDKLGKGSKLLFAIKPILVNSAGTQAAVPPTALRASSSVVPASATAAKGGLGRSAPTAKAPDFKPLFVDSVAPLWQEKARTERDAGRKRSVRDELQLLRSDVESLRGDVKRLIDLLEARTRQDRGNASSESFLDLNRNPNLLPVKPGKGRTFKQLGLTVHELDASVIILSKHQYRGGLAVAEVRTGGPAEKAGIRQGDVLVGLGRFETISHQNLAYVLSLDEVQKLERLKYYAVRGTETFTGHLSLEKGTATAAEASVSPATPEACVEQLVSAAQSDETEKLLSLLTQRARLEWTKVGLTGQRLGSHDGIKCVVGKAAYPNPGASVAHVPSVITTLDNGMTFAITWHLLRENEGWRIKGMAASISPVSERMFFDFENPAEMMQQATQEAVRQLQQKESRSAPTRPTPARPSTLDQGAMTRTVNFTVCAADSGLSETVAEKAEHFRRELSLLWLGKELPRWSAPCTIQVSAGDMLGAGGSSTFTFDGKVPQNLRMKLQGPRDSLEYTLAHEVMHTILATHFGRPLPRWIDEGIASTVESGEEQRKLSRALKQYREGNRLIPTSKIIGMMDYPADTTSHFAQSHAMIHGLIARGGNHQKLIEFTSDGLDSNDWQAALAKHYDFKNLEEFEQAWQQYAFGE